MLVRFNYVNFLIPMMIVVCLLIGLKGDEVKRRPKRYLRFLENSKYFIRLNTKHNMVPEFRIFAQATGFRLNLNTITRFGKFRQHKVARRELFSGLEQLILQHGFDGRACIMKSLCEASRIVTPESGIMLRLFKKIFTLTEGNNEIYEVLNSEECDNLDYHCPLSIINLSRYTDE